MFPTFDLQFRASLLADADALDRATERLYAGLRPEDRDVDTLVRLAETLRALADAERMRGAA